MTGNLHNILARIGARRNKYRDQYFVNYLIVKIPNSAEMYGMTLDFLQIFAAKYRITYKNRALARQANDAYRADARRRGYGYYGIL